MEGCQFNDIDHDYSHVIGDNIPHLHIHVIPRYKGAPMEFWGVKIDEWPEGPHGDKEQVYEFCKKIRHYLSV